MGFGSRVEGFFKGASDAVPDVVKSAVNKVGDNFNQTNDRMFDLTDKALPVVGEAVFNNPIDVASKKLIGKEVTPTAMLSNKLFGRNVVTGAGRELGASASNLLRTAGWLSQPTNTDDFYKGAWKAGNAVKEHPGVVKDVAKEVIKSETTPEAIIGTVALAVATAGLGTAASAGAKGAEGATTAAKTAEAISAGTRGAEAATGAAEAAQGATRASKLAKVLGTQETTATKFMHPVSTYVTQPLRDRAAQAILDTAGEGGPSLARQAFAANVQQGGGRIMPKQLEGISPTVRKGQEATASLRGAANRAKQAQAAPDVLHATADPVGYATDKAMAKLSSGGRGGRSGTYETFSGGQAKPPEEGGAVIPTSDTPGVEGDMAVSANGVVTPAGPAGRQASFQGGLKQKPKGTGRGTGANRMHAWDGPNREAFGGIDPNFDWRPFQLRPTQPWGKPGRAADGEGEGEGKSEMYSTPDEMPPLEPSNVAAKPIEPAPTKAMSAAVEAPKMSSMYAQPATTAGPRVMPAAGAVQRGNQVGRGQNFTAGITTEQGDYTIGSTVQPTKLTGSMTFSAANEDLVQPGVKKPEVVGTATPVGNPMSFMPNQPIGPMRPLSQPIKNRGVKPRQVLGV